MNDRIILGRNGNEHGLWVSKPGSSVQDGSEILMSSVKDMLKIHAQGTINSQGTYRPAGPAGRQYRHNIVTTFPPLDYVPLAFIGFQDGSSEPFSFPPNLRNLVESHSISGLIYNVMPVIGINHEKIVYESWMATEFATFNYTIFLLKLRDKF